MYMLAPALIIFAGFALSLVFSEKKKLIWIVSVCCAILSVLPYLLSFFVELLHYFQ